jgi:hypothetical protein
MEITIPLWLQLKAKRTPQSIEDAMTAVRMFLIKYMRIGHAMGHAYSVG